ncbi:MAG: TrmH family RNA methyltransferase [Treponema sp.]|nr:TrmH family RNA methyltransferase [Treponema sp.]
MIPLRKLAGLPGPQRLRKAANIAVGAQRQLAVSGRLEAAEAEYLGALAALLAKDEGVSPAQAVALEAAAAALAAREASASAPGKETRRALAILCHILLSGTGRHQADWDFTEPSGALDPSKRRPFPGMRVYLEDIRSPFNVGAMFRAAESFGAEKLWLSPLCADPRHKRAQRTAMGCVDVLPWERFSHDPFAEGQPWPCPEPEAGPFFTLETGGTPLACFPFPPRGILIAGSEELGVSPRALEAADSSLGRVTIPAFGAKGSLNVSVAFGIVMQAWAAALTKPPGLRYP